MREWDWVVETESIISVTWKIEGPLISPQVAAPIRRWQEKEKSQGRSNQNELNGFPLFIGQSFFTVLLCESLFPFSSKTGIILSWLPLGNKKETLLGLKIQIQIWWEKLLINEIEVAPTLPGLIISKFRNSTNPVSQRLFGLLTWVGRRGDGIGGRSWL